jgi:hypothetical protein
MIRDNDLLKSAKSGKARAGQRELVRWLEGGRLTRAQAVKAKCYDCSGMGDSGKCDLEGCPLLPFSPYSLLEVRFQRARKAKKGIPEDFANPQNE